MELKSYAFKTHQGPHLNLNEDLVEVDLSNKLYMLIDGFGGSNVGDRVAGIVRDVLKRSYTKIAIDPESTLPFYYSHKYLIEGNALINAMYSVHNSILLENDEKAFSSKGGASVIAVAASENILTIVSTGNCSGYLLRRGVFVPIVIPDILGSYGLDKFGTFFQSIPMSGIGLFEDLHVQTREVRVMDGDKFLFLSDGVYARVDESDLRFILEKNKDKESEAIKEMFKLANERGNIDNQSALVLSF